MTAALIAELEKALTNAAILRTESVTIWAPAAREILAALSAQQAGEGWRPIENAPKDARLGAPRILLGAYADTHPSQLGHWRYGFGHWKVDCRGDRYPGEWSVVRGDGGFEPTHWMPPPAPPLADQPAPAIPAPNAGGLLSKEAFDEVRRLSQPGGDIGRLLVGSDAGEGELKPCPFCGSNDIDPEGWASIDRSGPACSDCSASANSLSEWKPSRRSWRRRPLGARCRPQVRPIPCPCGKDSGGVPGPRPGGQFCVGDGGGLPPLLHSVACWRVLLHGVRRAPSKI
jgi:hypothetical protein